MKETKLCSKCSKSKKPIDFYKSYSALDSDERVRICKICLKDMVDVNNLDTILDMLRMIDKPFIYHLWESANTKQDVVGEYFKLINRPDCRALTWQHSIFNNGYDESTLQQNPTEVKISEELLTELKEKYGHGYPDNEYVLFEKRFRKLKPSFKLPTTMHEEYLREYCVNKVKETLAKAKGDFKEAKEWANMAKESATGGKLMPSQMSKADLSDGLEGFGQLARMVEERQDIIPLLPKFTERPKDKVDVTLWCYINYVRDLQGMEPVEYKEIYHFYEKRRQDYENNMLDEDDSMQKGAEEDSSDGEL